MEAVALNEQPLRWQVRTVGREGFEFGLDAVTPVAWTVVRSRKSGDAEYSFALPAPDSEAYLNWLREHRGKTVFASVQELRGIVTTLRKPS
jgi:hypothetical protein